MEHGTSRLKLKLGAQGLRVTSKEACTQAMAQALTRTPRTRPAEPPILVGKRFRGLGFRRGCMVHEAIPCFEWPFGCLLRLYGGFRFWTPGM